MRCWCGYLSGARCRLHMVQLMPLHPKAHSYLASFKSTPVLPFWYRLTQFVLEKRPLVVPNAVILEYIDYSHSEWTTRADGYVPVIPYLGSLITEDGECTTEFHIRLNKRQAIAASLQKIWKSHSIPISTKIRLTKALVWPVATYGCESWTLRKNEETCLDAYETKGLRKILRVSWTAKKTNERGS